MDRPERTDAPRVCLDSDVVIAGHFSSKGASHALLMLAEMGLISVVLPSAGVAEVERNLTEKLPEALPLFTRFLGAGWVDVHVPTAATRRAAKRHAHPKDVPILAAAISAGATILVTHNTRHYRKSEGVRVLKPGALLREIRAWMIRFET